MRGRNTDDEPGENCELPPVFEWQQKAWRPDCDRYCDGRCGEPTGRSDNASCPFDDKELPLREVTSETSDDQPGGSLEVGPCDAPKSQPRIKALEQAIVGRTGGRIRALAIQLTEGALFVRGTAPCYYVKQLALQGVLDVLRGDQETKVGYHVQILACPPNRK